MATNMVTTMGANVKSASASFRFSFMGVETLDWLPFALDACGTKTEHFIRELFAERCRDRQMQNTSHAVMAQRSEARDSLDDFPTPPVGYPRAH